MKIEIELETAVRESFRVSQVAGLFDVPVAAKSRLTLAAEAPGLDTAWTIGAIVGPSGSGKSSVARRAFGEAGVVAAGALVEAFGWPDDEAVVDGFDAKLDGKAITGMLNAVGFSSPPAWVRPYRVLSNGERFRCDLARALLLHREVVAFDEFTSVVDRQVARFGSAAVARAIRKGRARCRRFVAVTCHYDVLDWLEPDWWLDMATSELRWNTAESDASHTSGADAARGRVRRPPIELVIARCRRDLWRTFSRHHYLSGALAPSARCYTATWDHRSIAFCATIPLFGRPGRRIVHRLVVLPDYQGLGVGRALLDTVAAHETNATGQPVSIVTSHPALIRALSASAAWRCIRVNRCSKPQRAPLLRHGKKVGTLNRFTASFRYRPRPQKAKERTTDEH